MKKCSIIPVFILLSLLAGCSSDDSSIKGNSRSSLSFGIFLEDFILNTSEDKQATSNIPSCSDADPAFAELVLSRDGLPVVGTIDSPYQIALLQNNINGAGEIFTEESSELELEPGTYTLDYFQVFDGEGNMIWTAPLDNNSTGFGKFVDTPLPLTINLGAGVKKYVEVDVLCFDDRFVNQYGYSFFQLEGTEALEFCIFGNYCLENGRHAEAARYSVSIWDYSGNPDDPKGANFYKDVENSIIITDFEDESETSAEPLCFVLPDREGTDEYYLELKLLVFDYESEEAVIRKGVFTDEDVKDLFIEGNTLNYYHFREGNCGMEDSPQLFEENGNGVDPNLDTDGDGIVNIEDNCPYQYNPSQGGVDYFGDVCTDPCKIKTDEEDHLAVAMNGTDDFIQFESTSYFIGSVEFLHKELTVGSIYAKTTGPNELTVEVFIDAGRYLEDHVLEIRDDLDSESFCKKIHPVQIVPGEGVSGAYSVFKFQMPEEISAPYYVRFKGNLFVNFD
ncbi:thrombospondin type 3 repeat-containing protein [Salinimicrobium catena]|uniref:thrombospondin type 3 repeat-containing protein n=1 Tax=Salinimicrobium catena TaxID=390640 RepID=UPI003A5C8979